MSPRPVNVDAKPGPDVRSQSSASSHTAVEKVDPKIEGLGLVRLLISISHKRDLTNNFR